MYLHLNESNKHTNFHFSFLNRKQEELSLTFASIKLLRKLLFIKFCESVGQLAKNIPVLQMLTNFRKFCKMSLTKKLYFISDSASTTVKCLAMNFNAVLDFVC